MTAETEEMYTGHRSDFADIQVMHQDMKYENGAQLLLEGFLLKTRVNTWS